MLILGFLLENPTLGVADYSETSALPEEPDREVVNTQTDADFSALVSLDTLGD